MKLPYRILVFCMLAFILSIFPLPQVFVPFRPAWVLLLALYVQFFLPRYFYVSGLFFLGLCLDGLQGTVMGENAFVLLSTAWLASRLARRFYFFPIGQQWCLIGLFCCFYQSILLLIEAFLGFSYGWLTVFGSASVSVLIWMVLPQLMGERIRMSGENEYETY